MAGNRTDPPQPGHPPPARQQPDPDPGPEERDPGPEPDPGPHERDPDPEPDPGPHEEPGEHCGPLAIARRRKGDGRALILYTREERRRT